MRRRRGAEIAIVFQDPLTALNPVFTIGDQISEVLRAHQRIGRAAAHRRAVEILRERNDELAEMEVTVGGVVSTVREREPAAFARPPARAPRSTCCTTGRRTPMARSTSAMPPTRS